MNGFEDVDICTRCGGTCCKHGAGIVSPSDLFPDVEDSVCRLLQSGNYVVVRLQEEGLTRYYLRPKHVVEDIHNHSRSTACIFLTDTGCSLPFRERPYECRMLKPRSDFKCILHCTQSHDLVMAWKPYQGLLEGGPFPYADWT